MEDEKNRPVKRFRAGNGVAVAVFENTGEFGAYYTAQLTKSYRKNGELEEQRLTCRIADLALIAKACDRIHSWSCENSPESE